MQMNQLCLAWHQDHLAEKLLTSENDPFNPTDMNGKAITGIPTLKERDRYEWGCFSATLEKENSVYCRGGKVSRKTKCWCWGERERESWKKKIIYCIHIFSNVLFVLWFGKCKANRSPNILCRLKWTWKQENVTSKIEEVSDDSGRVNRRNGSTASDWCPAGQMNLWLLVTRANRTAKTHKHALHLIKLLFDVKGRSPLRPFLNSAISTHSHHAIPCVHQSCSAANPLTASRPRHQSTISLILNERGVKEHVSGDQLTIWKDSWFDGWKGSDVSSTALVKTQCERRRKQATVGGTIMELRFAKSTHCTFPSTNSGYLCNLKLFQRKP